MTSTNSMRLRRGEGARAEALELDFARTMEALARGFRVGDIATFPLERCDAAESVEKVRARYGGRFDHVPVQAENRVVGVLQLTGSPARGKVAKQMMRQLSDSMLIEENASLLESLDSLAGEQNFRLVLRRSRVEAIVTPSDLLKLPVRALAFSVITQLERVMAECIRAGFERPDDWLARLSEKRRNGVLEKESRLRKDRRDPDRLELTDLCDKRTLCRGLVEGGKRALFEKELKAIEDLRNKLAHGGRYVADGHGIDRFVENLSAARRWLDVLVKSAVDLRAARES